MPLEGNSVPASSVHTINSRWHFSLNKHPFLVQLHDIFSVGEIREEKLVKPS